MKSRTWIHSRVHAIQGEADADRHSLDMPLCFQKSNVNPDCLRGKAYPYVYD